MTTTLTRTERHIINKSHSDHHSIDTLCLLAKNLYNQALFIIRKNYFSSGYYINYDQIYPLIKDHKDYKALPAQMGQQNLRLLDKNWKAFFEAKKEYQENPDKFKGKPGPPNYKEKRSIAIFAGQEVQLKDNQIHFPKRAKLLPLATKVTSKINQVRVVPQATCYIIEVVYEKEVPNQETTLDLGSFLSIDLGVNNLATCVNNIGQRPFIVNGRVLKSINQFYNKMLSRLKILIFPEYTSNRTKKLTYKRNNRVTDYLHKTSRFIVNYCVETKINVIIIGHNTWWKNEVNIGQANNQTFVQIPHTKLIEQITYKAEEVNIQMITNEEWHTSKCSFLDDEPVCHQSKYLGRRIKRGLFKSAKGILINSDVQGALNIAKKAIAKVGAKLGLRPITPAEVTEGTALHPVRVSYPDKSNLMKLLNDVG